MEITPLALDIAYLGLMALGDLLIWVCAGVVGLAFLDGVTVAIAMFRERR